MGLATIDPHSQKEHTKIHKIPKFGVNQASFDWDTAILKKIKINKEMYGIQTLSDTVSRCLTLIFFVNFDVFKLLYLSQN